MENQTLTFDIPGIQECQQNRYPMLFIDRVTECIPLKYAKGFKLFTFNEWYFHGYETSMPKVWNVIQIEAMSQMFLMTFLTDEKYRGLVAMSNKFDKVQFFRKIIPGERLDIVANLDSFGRGVARGSVKGFVNSMLACSMECTIVIPDFFANFIRPSSVMIKHDDDNFDVSSNNVVFGVDKIQECLLNKYPWMFLDSVTKLEPGKFVRAIKNFTYNEHYFPVHFPDSPSVPGFIQIECCMQSFLLTFLSLDEYKRKETADRLLRNVHLKRKIVPGDCLEMFAYLDSFSRGIAKGHVESFVNGEPAISLEVTVVVVDELEKFKPNSRL